MKVLILHRADYVREMIRDWVKHLQKDNPGKNISFHIHKCESMEDAYKANNSVLPDLIMTGYIFNRINRDNDNGLAFISSLKSGQSRMKNVHFCLFTSEGDEGAIAQECARLGVDFIYIPDDFNGVIEYLEKLFASP